MKLVSREREQIRILEIHGQLILGLGDVVLRKAVEKLLKEERKKIIVHLKNVKYLDSAGIGELIACTRSAHEQGAEIKLAEPPRRIREILMRFSQVFDIFDTEKEAIDSFAA